MKLIMKCLAIFSCVIPAYANVYLVNNSCKDLNFEKVPINDVEGTFRGKIPGADCGFNKQLAISISVNGSIQETMNIKINGTEYVVSALENCEITQNESSVSFSEQCKV